MLPLLLLACAVAPGDGPQRPDPDTGVDDPCAPSAAVAITAVTSAQPWHENEAEVRVELSAKAPVALRCTLDGDPEEVHLVESTTAATRHTLRLAGLLASSTYACAVAPTCPQAADGPATFSLLTGAPPDDLPATTVWTAEGAAPAEYVLANASDDCDWQTQLLVVFDRAGRGRWWYRTPRNVGPSVEFVYRGADRFAWGGGWSPNPRGRPRLVDLYDGEVWDSAVALPDVESTFFHHDGKALADGRWATLEENTVEGDRGAFQGFQVRILDPETEQVEVTYDSQRAVDEGHLPSGTGDAWHANWVDLVRYDDRAEIYVNLRDLSWLVAVDADSGDWRWTFGAGGDFTLRDSSGEPLGDDGFPSWAHGAQFDGRTLLIYDNGVSPRRSRVVAYDLDVETFTATLLWEWTEADWYESTLGSTDWLPDGRVLVGAGHAECFSTNPGDRTTLLEIDPATGEKRWELRYDDVETMAYRADWADPCALFANGRYCPAVAERAAELASVFER